MIKTMYKMMLFSIAIISNSYGLVMMRDVYIYFVCWCIIENPSDFVLIYHVPHHHNNPKSSVATKRTVHDRLVIDKSGRIKYFDKTIDKE